MSTRIGQPQRWVVVKVGPKGCIATSPDDPSALIVQPGIKVEMSLVHEHLVIRCVTKSVDNRRRGTFELGRLTMCVIRWPAAIALQLGSC